MTFTPRVWALAVASCYPPAARDDIIALWEAHPGYFFELHPAPGKTLDTWRGQVVLFERAPETFKTILDICAELTECEPDLAWDEVTRIWSAMRPWYDKFKTLHNFNGEMMCTLRDPENLTIGGYVHLRNSRDRLVDYLDDEVLLDRSAWEGTNAYDFVEALTLSFQLLDMLRPAITGKGEIEFLHTTGEVETAEIVEHLMYGLRAFYLWLSEQRVRTGLRLLGTLTKI